MKKRQYTKPSTDIIKLSNTTSLLQASNLDSNIPLDWGVPGFDR